MKNYLALIYTCLILVSCSKDNEPIVLSSENSITSFALSINGEIVNGTIDQMEKTISFDLVGAELSSLKPIVQYSNKATLSPSENESQDFNNEVVYQVIAENGESSMYKIIIYNRPIGVESKILTFSTVINNETIEANINHDDLSITFNSGSFDRTALSPIITISEHATISPDPSIPQNFETPVKYTVTAENGDISVYDVMVNAPTISNMSSRPILLFTRASLFITGNFLDPNLPGAELYLFDGTNKYSLPMTDSSSYEQNAHITVFNFYTKIPENIPTHKNYRIGFRTDHSDVLSDIVIDILAENAPKFVSLNQTSYSWNDVLVITGENLTEIITIPSNGSIFIVKKSGNYDYTLNSSKTEISLILDYRYFFPSHFGRLPTEKTISFRTQDGRMGESFTTIFN
ncbi:DUF5018 domain-containing protein [Gelidibacter japonicus]|uniref:DUF5018 domain-containing protein n=1 Tax=Gelidibacter japonicus TaxID=1962232 RepID=UPI0013D0E7BF|nr:DUF5018 domain-containing protein [Gelidibacter japonicus]